MTQLDTYQKLLTIGEFGHPPDFLDKKRTKLIKKYIGIDGVKGIAFGRNLHTIRLDLEGWTLFAYAPCAYGSLVLYKGDFESGVTPERTFDDFDEVREFFEENINK